MTPLKVAHCPRCQGPLVFGEQACRTCGQTFDYGVNAPAVPTDAQLVAALLAVGLEFRGDGSQPRAAGILEGLDSGRYADAGDVEQDEVAGLMETAMFRAATPQHVDVQQVFGFDGGRFADARAATAIAEPPGLERTALQDAGAPVIAAVPGRFGSDIYRTPHGVVDPLPLDGFDPSPSLLRTQSLPSVPQGPLDRVLCRCSEVHRLARCPVCGTPHPDRS